ncbi:MAG: hypothetical protein WC499_01880 [Patescibacteria group bacterium]
MGYVIFSVAIFIFLFLIFRDVVHWYWRINEIVPLLKKINNNLEKINDNSQVKKIPE